MQANGSRQYAPPRLITADGNILTADETANPDLLWAVRGGGNFGVIAFAAPAISDFCRNRRSTRSRICAARSGRVLRYRHDLRAWPVGGAAARQRLRFQASGIRMLDSRVLA